MKKYEGGDVINSLLILFNRIFITSTIPTSREDLKMTSVYEKQSSKQELDRRIGLLIIDITSKVFGKNHKNKNRVKVTLSPYPAEEYQVKVQLTVLTHSEASLIIIFFGDYRIALIRCDTRTLLRVNRRKSLQKKNIRKTSSSMNFSTYVYFLISNRFINN